MKLFAFKEWQVVCDALEAGEQTLILRKGGISEGKLGFQWLHDAFLIFPTHFHEQVRQVKGTPQLPPAPAAEAPVTFRLHATTEWTARLTRWEEVQRLSPFHIWTDDAIRERFEWGEEPGISLAVVRVRKLVEPWTVPHQAGFGGCRSWIGLPEPDHDILQKAVPVLDEASFADQVSRISEIIGRP